MSFFVYYGSQGSLRIPWIQWNKSRRNLVYSSLVISSQCILDARPSLVRSTRAMEDLKPVHSMLVFQPLKLTVLFRWPNGAHVHHTCNLLREKVALLDRYERNVCSFKMCYSVDHCFNVYIETFEDRDRLTSSRTSFRQPSICLFGCFCSACFVFSSCGGNLGGKRNCD